MAFVRDASEEKDSVIRKAKWASLKAEWLEDTITNRLKPWPEYAKKYGFNVVTVRMKASQGKWYAEVAPMKAEREGMLESKLTERTTIALDKLNEDFATNEVSIRKRHAMMARGLQAKAMGELKTRNLSEFKPRDLLAMLQIGLQEERFAMGMKEIADPMADTSGHRKEYQPLLDQLGGHKKVQSLGMQLLRSLRDMPLPDVDEVTDAEVKDPTPASTPTPEPVAPPAAPVQAPAAYQPVPEARKPPTIIIPQKK